MNVYILLPCLLLTSYSYGSNILAILPMPCYSHQIAYTHIWKELSLRGHKVTVLTTDPLNDPKLTNLTEIDLNWTYKFMEQIADHAHNDSSMWSMHWIVQNMFQQIAEAQLSHPKVQDLIHNKSRSFDVVLVEFLFPEYLAFAKIFNCPKIIFGSLDATGIFHESMGNANNPILYPEIGLNFFGPMSFKERVISTLYYLFSLYSYSNSFTAKSALVKKHFNVSWTVHELVNDIDMMFINVNPILQSVRALGPSTITIGGNRGVVDSTPLPQDIAEFLDNAVDGFIYFSLGSNVKSKDLQTDTRDSIIEALRELPYRVLWKYEADDLPNKPHNVKLIKWAPQQTVLSHPNIKVFVTQGGLQSMEEAIYREVPCVVIPFFGDQDQNARLMESKGFAVIVNRKPSLNKTELKNGIFEVINSPKYRNTVKKLKQLALDFPMTGLEKAVWWTEYVVRNKGAKHLRNPAADIPFYQYYLIDVISFFVLLLISVLALLYVIFKTIYRYIRSCVITYFIVSEKKSQ